MSKNRKGSGRASEFSKDAVFVPETIAKALSSLAKLGGPNFLIKTWVVICEFPAKIVELNVKPIDTFVTMKYETRKSHCNDEHANVKFE